MQALPTPRRCARQRSQKACRRQKPPIAPYNIGVYLCQGCEHYLITDDRFEEYRIVRRYGTDMPMVTITIGGGRADAPPRITELPEV